MQLMENKPKRTLPPGMTPFKPGQRPPPKRPGAQFVRKLTAKEFEETVNVLLFGNVKQLEWLASDKNTTEPLKAMIAAVALRAIAKGDYLALGALLDRLIGKVREAEPVAVASDSTAARLKATYTAAMQSPEAIAALRVLAETGASVGNETDNPLPDNPGEDSWETAISPDTPNPQVLDNTEIPGSDRDIGEDSSTTLDAIPNDNREIQDAEIIGE